MDSTIFIAVIADRERGKFRGSAEDGGWHDRAIRDARRGVAVDYFNTVQSQHRDFRPGGLRREIPHNDG